MGRKRGGSRKERGSSRAMQRPSHPQRNLLPGHLEEHNNILATPQLSLIDIARNTERHRDGIERRQEVTGLKFIHGGMLEGSLKLTSTPLHQVGGPRKASPPPRDVPIDHCEPKLEHGCSRTSTQLGETEDISSESNDDVIIFQGRRTHNRDQSQLKHTESHTEPRKHISHQSPASNKSTAPVRLQPNRRTTGTWRSPMQSSSKQHKTATKSYQHRQSLYPEHQFEDDGWATQTSEDEAALQDYITNVIAHELSFKDDWLPQTGTGHSAVHEKLDHMLAQEQSVLQPSPARTPPQTHGEEPGHDAESFVSDVERSTSVDTVDQATHDLQIVFDESGQYEQDVTRTTFEPMNRDRSQNIRSETKAAPPEVITFEVSRGDQEAALSDVSMGNLDLSLDPSFVEGVGSLQRNAFDVTDRSRKSIADNTRTDSEYVDLELSDSELERALLESWNKDKAKKRHRKKEREEARAKGLIGSRRKGQSPDTDQLNELGWEALSSQIKAFVLSDSESLTLMPMSKRSRRVVHEFAIALNLKSKSIGSGQKRFPTLTRTPRTVQIGGGLFEAVDARLARRFTIGTARQFRTEPAGKGLRYGKSSFAAASYREGEVVGAAAPEIGLDNRGRAMLERMGWSSGTALGAANNKGILLPVAHTVKNSKLGLG